MESGFRILTIDQHDFRHFSIETIDEVAYAQPDILVINASSIWMPSLLFVFVAFIKMYRKKSSWKKSAAEKCCSLQPYEFDERLNFIWTTNNA